MNLKKILILAVTGLALILSLSKTAPPAQAAPDIFVTPLHAGCYLAKAHLCKIHVEPYTLNVTAGTKLVQFQLNAIRSRDAAQITIYDWRPDTGNPVPFSGTAYSPSAVAKDFAATCSEAYSVRLQGMDSGTPSLSVLGTSGLFTCPVGTYSLYMPSISH